MAHTACGILRYSAYMHCRIANYACEPSENLGSSSAEIRKRTAIEDNPYPLVEAAGLEPTVSSSRSRNNMFFEHNCLHIVRIFREITLFCTLFPLFPYRTFPVVVSYVVKPFLLCKRFDSGQLKMEN